MIAFIKGCLVQTNPMHIIIEANGIGYKIFIPTSVFSKLPQLHETCLLYTSFVIREMSQTLYGFLSEQERDLFEILMGVSGIGPKLALSLIGHLPLQEMSRAISSHDIITICKVPGIGKKTAERLIIELRDKFSTLFPVDRSDLAVHELDEQRSRHITDAMSALINLGYNQVTAQKAIKKTLKDFPESIDLGELITSALKHVN